MKLDAPARPQHATIAIDAPLGFPEALTELTKVHVPISQVGESAANPYPFRHTERRLVAEGITPLSTVKDMIGSQATTAMHVVARFAPALESCGAWTDRDCLTVIESYPRLCRARRGPRTEEGKSPKKGRDADIRDARSCAEMAHDFKPNPTRLEHPNDGAPESEGRILGAAALS